jgi:hypothetical protein
MARHLQYCHQATSERQVAVTPLGLITVQSWNLRVARQILAQQQMHPQLRILIHRGLNRSVRRGTVGLDPQAVVGCDQAPIDSLGHLLARHYTGRQPVAGP